MAEFFGKYSKYDAEIQMASYLQVPLDTEWVKAEWPNMELEPVKSEGSMAGIAYAHIKGADGTLHKVPLKTFPMIESNFGIGPDAPNYKLTGVSFEIDSVVYEFDGSTSVIQGPFVTKETYQKLLPFSYESYQALKDKPDMVILEHGGIQYDLKAGDTLTVNMPVEINGKKLTEFHETIKVVEFGHKPSTPPGLGSTPKFQAPLSNPQFGFELFTVDQGKTVLITGYYENKRYEVVLGTPVSTVKSRMVKELFGDDVHPSTIPNELYKVIVNANTILVAGQEVGPNHSTLKHPAMQQVVKCPAGGDYTNNLQTVIMHLNDTHEWTREQIADWIDTLDEQPVYYPILGKPEGVANSAKVVALATPVQEGIE